MVYDAIAGKTGQARLGKEPCPNIVAARVDGTTGTRGATRLLRSSSSYTRVVVNLSLNLLGEYSDAGKVGRDLLLDIGG